MRINQSHGSLNRLLSHTLILTNLNTSKGNRLMTMKRQVELSRKQELYLIDLGLQKLLDSLIVSSNGHSVKKAEPVKRGWSPAQRKRFAATMKRVWKKKRALKSKETE